MKRIVLCADDYGQAEAVSGGIIELLCIGRLTATSCMVNMPGWQDQSGWLEPFKGKVDIGLHLNFTEGKPCSSVYQTRVDENFMSLPRLLRETHLGSKKLTANILESEIDAQIDAFEDALGMTPNYIDGHQHVHHLPLIREVVASVYHKRLKKHGGYVRLAKQKIDSFKVAIIRMTGGGKFDQFLDLHSIPHNPTFSGIYAFNDAKKYRHYFAKFVQDCGDRGLIMCHPGLQSGDKQDPLTNSRYLEYQYLCSEDFIADCEKLDAKLSRFVTKS